MQLKVIQSAPSLRERVYCALEEMIVNGHLTPGTHLKESELAQELGVSRNPVRAALLQLTHEGMARHIASRGIYVHTPTKKEISDTLYLREVLECEAVTLACNNLTSNQLEKMNEVVTAGFAELKNKQSERLLELNNQFHGIILEASNNEVLAQLMGTLSKKITWYFSQVVVPRADSSWQEHKQILEHLMVGDKNLARSAMKDHLQLTMNHINQNFQHTFHQAL